MAEITTDVAGAGAPLLEIQTGPHRLAVPLRAIDRVAGAAGEAADAPDALDLALLLGVEPGGPGVMLHVPPGACSFRLRVDGAGGVFEADVRPLPPLPAAAGGVLPFSGLAPRAGVYLPVLDPSQLPAPTPVNRSPGSATVDRASDTRVHWCDSGNGGGGDSGGSMPARDLESAGSATEDQSVPATTSPPTPNPRPPIPYGRGVRPPLLVCSLGAVQLRRRPLVAGLPLSTVVAVAEGTGIVPLPGAPPSLCGATLAGEQAIPVYDAGALLALPDGVVPPDGDGTLVVAGSGRHRLGLHVRAALGIERAYHWADSSVLAPLASPVAAGAVLSPERWIVVLDVAAIPCAGLAGPSQRRALPHPAA